MRRFLILFAVMVTASVPAMPQNGPSDSQTLRDILAEIRQMRHDLQTTTVAAQRIQIVLYRLQLQDAAVARASKTAEEAHAKLNEISGERKQLAALIEREQSLFESGTLIDNNRKANIGALKAELEQLTKDEPQWQSKAAEADAHLAREQSKLENLHHLLDELDEALQSAGGDDSKSTH
ncbi:MAG TPA: hypothetical protein VI685_09175 [Candidatus Angelobacter sp.]